MKTFLYAAIAFFCMACSSPRETNEKWQKKRDNVVDVRKDLKEISMEEPLIGDLASPYVYDKYLFIVDYKSVDKTIHVFDRHSYTYLFSFGDVGQGPTEMTFVGCVAWNAAARYLYVTDHGQRRVLSFQLDSLVDNPQHYVPQVKIRFQGLNLPIDYSYVNDTLAYGAFVKPFDASSYIETSGKWNMQTGDSKLIDYIHPAEKEAMQKRITFDVSMKHNTLVECNRRYDLITLYNLDGELRCNIYGPNWDASGDRKAHFGRVAICGDRIVASYTGEDWIKHSRGYLLHLFSITGDYLKTLDVGYGINRFCYDEETHRLIMNLDDECQFAYIDLGKY